MTEPSTTEPATVTRRSVEPIPLYVPSTLPIPEGMDTADAGLIEAFRQGWLSARHWPNHQLPTKIDCEVEETDDEHVTLTMRWE